MLTYEYECSKCGLRFERRQPMTDRPLTECPECNGMIRRRVSGGAGFIIKGSSQGRMGQNRSACSLTQVGKTCCGRDERCDKPPCVDKE